MYRNYKIYRIDVIDDTYPGFPYYFKGFKESEWIEYYPSGKLKNEYI